MTCIGLLLGHNEYVDHTKYMWKIDGLTKNHVKFAQTPYVFGSSASIEALWKKNKVSYTNEQVLIMRREQRRGKFAIANEFKDILIGHSHPEAIMQVQSGNERFTVECNRYKNVGDVTTQYVVYDSEKDTMKIVVHTKTQKVPDLKQFRRYFSSCIIHNLDSRIMSNICLALDWVLPIHDAGIVTWTEASVMREAAVKQMTKVSRNRKTIVEGFLKSINLDEAGWLRYAKLLERIEKAKTKPLVISPYLLK